MPDRSERSSSSSHSRRALLHGGAAAALLGAVAGPHLALAQGTPEAGEGSDILLIQAFSQASLFATQGDADTHPYTLILWDAAPSGLVYLSSGGAGVVSVDALLLAITAGAQPQAALVLPSADGASEQFAWALHLSLAEAGSDPGAVTYQGDLLGEEEATALLGVAPQPADDAMNLGAGYLLLSGFPAFDIAENATVRLTR